MRIRGKSTLVKEKSGREIMFLLGHRQDSRALHCNRILVRWYLLPLSRVDP